MEFNLSDEQKLLRDSLDRFIEREYTFDKRRQFAESEAGFSRDIWAKFAELGWLGVGIDEADGGYGGTAVDTMIIMEGFGRGLVVEPYLSTVVMGANFLKFGGTASQRKAILPALVEGKQMLAFAYFEPQARFNLADVETAAKKDGGGYVLNGMKGVVFHAASADRLIVSARTSGKPRDERGITLFLVERSAKGVSLREYATQDGLRAAELTLDKVTVGAEAVLGKLGGGLELMERVADITIAALAAEAVGAMKAMLAQTQEFLKTREQFGTPLSKFQVLQHMSVDMFMASELSKSMSTMAAMNVGDKDAKARARAASAAKVQIGRAGKFVGQTAVQLHGGMGMTDELPIGHYFKRLSMIDTMFGNADFHLKRFIALGGKGDPAKPAG